MKNVAMKLVNSRKIAKDTYEWTLTDDYMSHTVRPGQFIYIAVPGFTLRRPISIADVEREKKQLKILFKVVGKGTERMAALTPGTEIECMGPNGNGFPIEMEQMEKALLIGGGIGVPPLYYLGKELKQKGMEVISIIGFQNKEHVFYDQEFAEISTTIVVTDDGSYGEQGFVTDVLPDASDFDMYFACGPRGMLRAVKQLFNNKNGYLSLEERMGCGIGACAACIVATDTKEGYKKICQDGPVFAAKEVLL